MCLAVYLATDQQLPPIAWNEAAPAFYLEPVAAHHAASRQFSLPQVYYVGSHHGCGCGFSKDGEVGTELELCQANYNALGRTLRELLSRKGSAQLFTCWEGDQGDTPELTASVTPSQLEAPAFQLQELQLLRVKADV